MSTRAIIGGTIIHWLKYECFSGRFIQVKQARDSWPEEMCLEGPSGALTLEWWWWKKEEELYRNKPPAILRGKSEKPLLCPQKYNWES